MTGCHFEIWYTWECSVCPVEPTALLDWVPKLWVAQGKTSAPFQWFQKQDLLTNIFCRH
jgi:hypothetical protein